MEKEKVLSAAPDAIRQAELILKLYEVRREAVMRQARGYVGGEFMPTSVEDFVGLVGAAGKTAGYILQVYGYWDMVAAFVVHGALNEALVYDTCQEMYFQYAKIHPYLAGFREKMNLPEFLRSIERVVGRLGTRARAPQDHVQEPFIDSGNARTNLERWSQYITEGNGAKWSNHYRCDVHNSANWHAYGE